MRIKTREALRNIKPVDRAGELANKTKGGASSLNRSAEQTQNVGYESETEYAGNEVQDKEERIGKGILSGANRIGKWGVRETRRNIQKWRNRSKKLKVNTGKELPAPRRAMLMNKTAKVNKAKTASSSKAANRIAVRTAKTVIRNIKSMVTTAIVGGGAAVLIIVIISFAALIAGSVYGIFIPADDNAINVYTVMSEFESKQEQIENDLIAEYQYDVISYEGSYAEWKEVIAVYAVKTNLDAEEPRDVVNFNDGKLEELRAIYQDMNSVKIKNENREQEVTTLIKEDNGRVSEVTDTVTVIYAIVERMSISAFDLADKYSFTQQQEDMLVELLDDKNVDLWKELFMPVQ